MKRRIAILGSTGSIGTSALEVIASNPDRFEVVGLAAGSNVEKLAEQAERFHPKRVALRDSTSAERLSQRLSRDIEVASGIEGLKSVAADPEVDTVIAAIVGAAGLEPTLAAVEAGKGVALANKEALVMAGGLMTSAARKSGARLIPVDSEHNAIFQLLHGQKREGLERIVLTASGGPFWGRGRDELQGVTPEEALQHPHWEMGKKVTIDSATLTNKALEVMEARWLFDLEPSQIEVVIHPQSLVHSFVSFRDGSTLAQLAVADMKIPIAYALSYPDRIDVGVRPLKLSEMGRLEFAPPDVQVYPILPLAYRALELPGSAAVVLNAANEVAVGAFLDRRLSFLEISDLVSDLFESHQPKEVRSVEEILSFDAWAREEAQRILEEEKRVPL